MILAKKRKNKEKKDEKLLTADRGLAYTGLELIDCANVQRLIAQKEGLYESNDQ